MFTGASTEFESNHHPYKRYTDYPRQNLTLILFPRSVEHLQENHKLFQRSDLPKVHFISSYFISLVNKALTNYLRQAEGSRFNAKGHSHRASSGLRGIFAALLTCNHTDVYGFGASKKFGHGALSLSHVSSMADDLITHVAGHYYSQPSAGVQIENLGHNYTVERRFVTDLSKGRIRCADIRGLEKLSCGQLFVEERNVLSLESLLDSECVVQICF